MEDLSRFIFIALPNKPYVNECKLSFKHKLFKEHL